MRASRNSRTSRGLIATVILLATFATVAAAAATTATIDPSGNLLVNGSPFFPIGMREPFEARSDD